MRMGARKSDCECMQSCSRFCGFLTMAFSPFSPSYIFFSPSLPYSTLWTVCADCAGLLVQVTRCLVDAANHGQRGAHILHHQPGRSRHERGSVAGVILVHGVDSLPAILGVSDLLHRGWVHNQRSHVQPHAEVWSVAREGKNEEKMKK